MVSKPILPFSNKILPKQSFVKLMAKGDPFETKIRPINGKNENLTCTSWAEKLKNYKFVEK